jgi:hypothetical protein
VLLKKVGTVKVAVIKVGCLVIVSSAMFKVFTLLSLALLALFYSAEILSTKQIVVYDCRIAEIAVDFPQQVRERCRHQND